MGGLNYGFTLNSASVNGVPDPYLRLYDSGGSYISADDDSGGGLNSRLLFRPASSGRFCLSTANLGNSGTGAYLIAAQVVDDYSADTLTTASVGIGSVNTGSIESAGDVDWFRTTLTAGQSYLINLYGSPSGQGTLADPLLFGVYDAAGNLISGTYNDDGGASTEAVLRFTAPSTGTFYIAADAYGSFIGSYTVRLDEDDFADNIGTTGVLILGSNGATGTINTAGDRDWFGVSLSAGVTYTVNLRGLPSGAGTLSDPYIYGIRDSQGGLIAGTSNDDFGVSAESQVTFTPAVAGIYYVAAGAWAANTGSYSLSIAGQSNSDVPASTATVSTINSGSSVRSTIDNASDTDWFRATLTAGQSYVVELNADLSATDPLADPYFRGIYDAGGTLIAGTANDDYGVGYNSRVTFTPASSGTYYLAAGGYASTTGAYSLVLSSTSTSVDAIGNTPATAANLSIGSATSARIDPIRDVDWFRVTLTAGQNYVINQRGVGSGAGTLADPEIQGIYDANGVIIPGTGNNNSGGTQDAQTSFQPLISGAYFIGASAHNDVTGSYTLRIETAAATTDLPANATTSATLQLGGVLRSDIGSAGDVDWIRVSLTAGTVYTIQQLGSPTGDGSLGDPLIVGVFDATGQALRASGDDDSGQGTNALVTLAAPATGTYFVAAGAYGANFGTYSLSLSAGTADNTAPTLRSTSPLDNAATVPVRSNITLEFSETVRAGSGNILISSANGVRTIAVGDSTQVSFSGSTLTINPSVDLTPNTDYALTLAPGVVRDLAGNNFAGISSATDFNFRTAAATNNDDWTILIYVAADNNLEAAAIQDINEMESVALGANINVVVLVDRSGGYDTSNGNWTDTRQGLITPDQNLTTISSNLTTLDELNTGSAATLTNFINSSVAANPANRYALVIWDHGGGVSGTAWDDSNGNDNLTLTEMRQAVAASSIGGFDLIAFDACLQAMAEQMWELRGMADVVVASQELVPGDGFEYQLWLDAVRRNPALSAVDMGNAMVDAYRQRYAGEPNTTLSSTRMSAVPALAAALDQFVLAAINAGAGILTGLRGAISRTTAIHSASEGYRDLGDFMREVVIYVADTAVVAAANNVVAALGASVVASTGTVANANGLSVYLPSGSIDTDYQSQDFTFLQATAWGSFLRFLTQDTLSDTIGGDAGPNLIYGFGGNDVIPGQAGDDRIVGGAGNDTLTGGVGADTFVLAVSGNGLDTITDWAGSDKIVVLGVALTAGAATSGGSGVGGRRVEVSYGTGYTDPWIDTNNTAGAEVQTRILGTQALSDIIVASNSDGTSTIGRPVNLAPFVAAALPDQVAQEGAILSLVVPINTFSDPTNEPLIYSAQYAGGGGPLSGELSFNGSTRTLRAQPTGGSTNGWYNLSITATDPAGGSASDEFRLDVVPQGFNALNYIASYGDLRPAFGTNAAAAAHHYMSVGRTEGRAVSFDPLRYIAAYADLRAAFGTDAGAAARHYIQTGAGEGRNLRFDGRAYWAMNGAVRREAGQDQTAMARHFIGQGAAAGLATQLDGLRYVASHGDLIRAFGANATAGVSQFFANGFAEGRAVTFNPLAYVASYVDLMAAFGINAAAATTHYIASGFAEGRRVTFDPLRYVASNADLIAAFGTNEDAAAAHYIARGKNEGRQSGFDVRTYWAMNQSARAEAGTDAQALARHYISKGYAQGLATQFDALRYIASYADLMGAFQLNTSAATAHFLAVGYAEGRSASFDALRYLANNGDLVNAFGANTSLATQHYVSTGRTEGRGFGFDVVQYLLTNGDVRAAFGWNTDAATRHYIVAGRTEGRVVSLNAVNGNDAANTLAGTSGHDRMSGGGGNDLLQGNAGNDLLIGGAGSDELWGGSGADVFSFSLPSEGGDVIGDFISGTDTLLFSAAGFAGLTQGRLDASRLGGSSAELGNRAGFVYDALSGSLAFDPDGAGPMAAVSVVGLGPRTTLAPTDMVVGR